MRSPLLIALVLVATTLPPAGFAQEPQDKPQPQANASPRQPSGDPQPAAAANVRIQLVVTDTVGATAPTKKSVSAIVADGHMGRIRSNNQARGAQLNVDVTPMLRNGGRIQLRLAVQYQPPVASTPSEAARYSSVDEFITLLLDSGKPTLVSEASDPSTDRKVTVEVTATVLK